MGQRAGRTVLIWPHGRVVLLPRAYHQPPRPRPCYRLLLPLAAIADRKALAILSNRDRKSAAAAPAKAKIWGARQQRRPASGQRANTKRRRIDYSPESDANATVAPMRELTLTDASKSDETVAHPRGGDDDGCLLGCTFEGASATGWDGQLIESGLWSVSRGK